MSQPHESPTGSYLDTLLDKVLSEETPPDPSPAPQAQAASAMTAGNESDPLSLLLQNPALLSKLPTILSAAKPIMEILSGLSGQSAGAATPAPAITDATPSGNDDIAATAAAMAKVPQPSQRSFASKGDDRHTALLCAMKPYLSEDRRKAVDYILKLRSLGDLLKSLQ